MSADTNAPEWSEVERVVAAAIELPEDEQAVYLARQPASIRSEAESLLAAYRRSGSFLEQSTVACSPAASAAIAPNTQLGPYRVEAVIGEGGMGIVYRARDTRLNRAVAIKFLFEDLADAAGRRRFQREAQMASSLNHPHIVTVHDSGDFEGRQYLVTEYLDGGTLRDWARGQRRTWREIAELMSGLADGLATAHGAGILHRDLKPENILLSGSGYAKLSDFGLAKLQLPSEPEQTFEISTPPSTRSGIILGTISYMSPEQAAGRAVDTRSDIFSFGVVLYELIAGHRPFDGATDLETLQKIVHGPVPRLSADIPFALRILLEKALDKDPAARYQSTRDLAVDLRRLVRENEEDAPQSPSLTIKRQQPPRFPKSALVVASVVLAILLVAAGGLLLSLRRPIASYPLQAVEFEVPPPTGTLFAPTINRQPFAISPDGRRLAFTAASATGTNLWMRQLDSTEMHAVPGTDGAISVSWAPDSRSIFFSTKQTLMQLNLETGSGRSVATLPNHAQMVTWRANGNLLLYLGAHDSYEVSVEDGSLHKAPASLVRWPQFLPGSDRLLYVEFDPAAGSYRAYVSDYPVHKPVALMETGSRVQYAPPRRAGEPAHLLFMRGANLLAQAFDEGRLRLVGDAFPIAQNVIYYGPTLAANFSVSSNGVLVYQAGFPVSELCWYDRAGNVVGALGKPATHWGNVRISPDGQKVAATVWTPETGGAGIWIFDANGGASRRITFPPDVQRRPAWSPDGERLAFGGSKGVGGGPRLAISTLAQSGGLTASSAQFELNVPDISALPSDWSRDGRFIAFDDGTPHEVLGAYITDLAARKTLPVLQDKFAQWGVAFSPDGSQIAFVSVESGRPEAYLQVFDPQPSPHLTGERRQISKDGAWLVRWRGDGRELFYLGLDNRLYAAPVAGRLASGTPRPLFRLAGASQYNTTRDFQFDVSPDGQRFIMPTTGSVAPPAFTVVENWQDKFRR